MIERMHYIQSQWLIFQTSSNCTLRISHWTTVCIITFMWKHISYTPPPACSLTHSLTWSNCIRSVNVTSMANLLIFNTCIGLLLFDMNIATWVKIALVSFKVVSVYIQTVCFYTPWNVAFCSHFTWISIFKCVSNIIIRSLICSWHHLVVVSDSWFSSAHHIVTPISSSPFNLGPYLCVQF